MLHTKSKLLTFFTVAIAVLDLGIGVAVATTDHSVSTANQAFNARDLTVTQGDTVTWSLNGQHNVHFSGQAAGPFSQTYTKAFPDVGTFTYVCDAHSNMTGTVHVIAATTDPVPVASEPQPVTGSTPTTGATPTVGATSSGVRPVIKSIRLGRRHIAFASNQPVTGQATVLQGRVIQRFVRFNGQAPLVKANFRALRPGNYRVVLRVNGVVYRKPWVVK
jgi:plastocyanin